MSDEPREVKRISAPELDAAIRAEIDDRNYLDVGFHELSDHGPESELTGFANAVFRRLRDTP